MTDETLLSGKRILLVEDEYVLANDLQRIFSEEGANVLGPIASVDDALDLIEAGETIDGAVLDMNCCEKPVSIQTVANALFC
ncbi:hypothetical protein AS026_26755 [Rhizobium altiplani]|uniref:Response regulatory domain-containing protein n=1 Tax=Rhizobium altiplani TaxID=1864509 RepID=A0A125Q415_9HYPH|nr:response regulator [Rhizobium altiplani]KWV40202.1 hypothetical protein AS026_26755 [Rhizobium altiplani]